MYTRHQVVGYRTPSNYAFPFLEARIAVAFHLIYLAISLPLLASFSPIFPNWLSSRPCLSFMNIDKYCIKRLFHQIYCYADALSMLALCLASYFSFFVFLFFLVLFFFPACRYVYLRVPLSAQQSATLNKYVFYSTCSFCLCHLYPTPSRNYYYFFLFVWYFFFFFVALNSRVPLFFRCALVSGTLALDFPTLILKRLIFLCLTACDHRVCFSLG